MLGNNNSSNLNIRIVLFRYHKYEILVMYILIFYLIIIVNFLIILLMNVIHKLLLIQGSIEITLEIQLMQP